ncbi:MULTISPECIES: hypothetical protein [unclassified Moorena]|nr:MULTISPECIES: hypothetical protein [unclassified Moorena]
MVIPFHSITGLSFPTLTLSGTARGCRHKAQPLEELKEELGIKL